MNLRVTVTVQSIGNDPSDVQASINMNAYKDYDSLTLENAVLFCHKVFENELLPTPPPPVETPVTTVPPGG